MRRTRLVLLLLALGAAALFLALEVRRRSPDPGEIDHAEETQETPATVRLEGRPPPEAESAPEPEREPTRAPNESIGPKVWLQGTVSVAGDRVVTEFSPSVEIEIQPEIFGLESIDILFFGGATLTSPGPYRVDLTELCSLMVERESQRSLWMWADHPDYAPVNLRVPMADPAALLEGAITLDPVDVVLRPIGTLTGTVEDVGGRPREHARVLLYRMTAGAPEPHPVDEVTTADDGRFRLRCVQTGPHLVVATYRELDDQFKIVRCPAPASRVVTLAVDRATTGVRLRLRPSLRVRGLVRFDRRAAARARLEWRLEGDVHPLRYEKNSRWGEYVGLAYTQGEVHWAWEEIHADERGALEILGLSALPYRLRVKHVPGTLLHREDEAGQSVIVEPSNDGVEIVLSTARLRLRVLDGDTPVRPSMLHVAAVGRPAEIAETLGEDDFVVWDTHQAQADDDGRVELRLSPGRQYTLWIEHEGYAAYHHLLTAPAGGETLDLVASLRPAARSGSLLVTLEGPAGEIPGFAAFGFYPADADSTQQTASPVRTARAVEGLFLLEDLTPGSHRLHVRPGRGWHGRPNDWLETHVEVDVPPEGQATCTIRIEKGGRLQITATDVEGRHLEAACTIRDETGAEVPAWFRADDFMGGAILSTGSLPGAGDCWLDSALPAGRYRVRLEAEGYESQEHEVRIQPGKPASVNAVLKSVR